MIDWDEVYSAKSEEELRKIKMWLFQENIRIQNEKNDLEARRDKLIQDKVRFRDEMNALNQKMVIEQKRIREENLFFDKKLEILQEGFKKLEIDRKNFEKEKRLSVIQSNDSISILFRNTNNSISLKKRYRELLKIYHPDNICGDAELVQLINKEFNKRKQEC